MQSRPNSFQLVLHYQADSKSNGTAVDDLEAIFTCEHSDRKDEGTSGTAEKKSLAGAPIPTYSRKSTTDAVIFQELNIWTSQQLVHAQNTNIPKERLAIFVLLDAISAAFHNYQFYHAECAAMLEDCAGKELKDEEAFAKMRTFGFYVFGSSPQAAAYFIKDLGEKRGKLQQRLHPKQLEAKKKENLGSFHETLFNNKDLGNQSTVVYLAKLGITPKNNHRHPADYLVENFRANADEPLLHVRHCDVPACTLNPDMSGFVKIINDQFTQHIVQYVTKNYGPEDTIYYGGFASGALLRDLTIIHELMKNKFSKFEFFFVDTDYQSLIQQVTDLKEVSVDQAIKTQFYSKTFQEFGGWLAANLPSDCAATIHIFSNVEQAERYFAKQPAKKLSVLVGEDFYCDHGTLSPAHATPGAHQHFMQFAKSALQDNRGGFFELIKDETSHKIFLHHGKCGKEEYAPLYTHIYDHLSYTLEQYPKTSLGFFTGTQDDPLTCKAGSSREVVKFNAQGKKSS